MFDFDLDDLLNEPTVQRSEITDEPTVPEESDFDLSELEFAPEIDTINRNDTEQNSDIDKEDEPYTPEMARENAEALVDFIDMGQVAVLTPVAKWKLSKKKRVKGKIAQMEIIAAKDIEGGKLTDREKRMLYQYKAYQESCRRIEESLPYTDDERERLTKAAEIYVKKTQFKMSKGLGFWGELSIIQGTRILEIITA